MESGQYPDTGACHAADLTQRIRIALVGVGVRLLKAWRSSQCWSPSTVIRWGFCGLPDAESVDRLFRALEANKPLLPPKKRTGRQLRRPQCASLPLPFDLS
jgi:hypothetical protein